MPKMKTHSGAAKRFKKLKSGKIKAPRAFRRHLMTGKTTNKKRSLRQASYVGPTDIARFEVLLPY